MMNQATNSLNVKSLNSDFLLMTKTLRFDAEVLRQGGPFLNWHKLRALSAVVLVDAQLAREAPRRREAWASDSHFSVDFLYYKKTVYEQVLYIKNSSVLFAMLYSITFFCVSFLTCYLCWPFRPGIKLWFGNIIHDDTRQLAGLAGRGYLRRNQFRGRECLESSCLVISWYNLLYQFCCPYV